jgi:hypothetical protein
MPNREKSLPNFRDETGGTQCTAYPVEDMRHILPLLDAGTGEMRSFACG